MRGEANFPCSSMCSVFRLGSLRFIYILGLGNKIGDILSKAASNSLID